jgi:hypothetical protein
LGYTKEPELQQMHQAALVSLNPEQGDVEIGRVEELAQHCGLRSERDTMGAYVATKMNLW